MNRTVHQLLGLTLSVLAVIRTGTLPSRRRDERGLSQSTENAILLAGAVAVAGIVITVITAFVQSRLPK